MDHNPIMFRPGRFSGRREYAPLFKKKGVQEIDKFPIIKNNKKTPLWNPAF
jgi:hypothetical protein